MFSSRRKEPRPILRRVQNANGHDGFLKWLVENQNWPGS